MSQQRAKKLESVLATSALVGIACVEVNLEVIPDKPIVKF